MAKSGDLIITDLSGGLNDTDPATSLEPNQCTVVENIEFWQAPCGARRLGSSAITLSASLSGKTAVTFLHRHLPTTDITAAQLWVFATTVGVSSQLAYKDTAWHDVSFVDAITNTGVYPYQIRALSLHGKLFFAYKSALDRGHVWDGTTLRRIGLAEPAAPSAANTGVGTFSGTRYYRVRYTIQVAGTTTLRSEPSDSLTFSPSGTGTAARVTKPATISESETHWELEASLDNTNFYRIATTVVGTTTFDDSASSAVGYATGTNVLSEDVGDYTVPPSCRYMIADKDRLVLAGSFDSDTQASVVRWTPVLNDPGVGNDERIPIDTNNLLNLDGYEGGGITGLASLGGVIIVFKYGHIYRLVSTGQRDQAYEPNVISKSRGAIEGSVIEGVDQFGSPCLYFLDPKVGPCRIGAGGLLWAGADILVTWRTVNLNAATVQARAVYYPDKQQVHWWVATGSADIPSLRLVLQTDDTRINEEGVQFGWARHSGGTVAGLAACLFSTNIESNTTRSLNLKPFVAVGNTVQMMDTGNTDNGVTYTATLTSHPFLVSGTTINQFAFRTVTVIGDANANAAVAVGLIRDFGLETNTKERTFAPELSETLVIKDIDDLVMDEARAIQIQLTDGSENTGQWTIHHIALRPTTGQSG